MELKRLFLLAAVILSAVHVVGQTDPHLQGRAFMVKEQYDSAVIYLENALLKDPGDLEIMVQLGLCRFKQNDFTAAYDAFYEVERRRTGMASYYLSKTELKRNHPDQALKYLRIHLSSRYRLPEKEILLDEEIGQLESHPGWQKLWNEKKWYSAGDRDFQEAMFQKDNGNYLDAINLLNKLEKQGYERSRVQAEKADIYSILGNEKTARTEIKAAVESDVRNLDALMIHAGYLVKDASYEDAVIELSKLIRKDPARFEAYLLRARAKSGNGDLRGAIQDMDSYLAYFPEDDHAHYQKGLIQFSHGRYLNAIQSYNRSLELNSGEASYYFARGVTYAATGTVRYAEKDLSMALDLDPLNGETWYEKGRVSEKLGKQQDACHCYGKAFQYGIFEARDYLDKNCTMNHGGEEQR